MSDFQSKIKTYFPLVILLILLFCINYKPFCERIFSPLRKPIKKGFDLFWEYLIIPPIGYLVATILTVWGIYQMKEMYKVDTKKINWQSPLQGYMKGWAAAIGITIFGFLIYYFKVTGKI